MITLDYLNECHNIYTVKQVLLTAIKFDELVKMVCMCENKNHWATV